MSGHRSRGYSPPRYYSDQPRATTGTVYATSFDTGSRGGSAPLQRSSVSTVPSGRHSVAYQAQPMRKSTYADGKTRTEYAIRPRNEPFGSADGRRPPNISTEPISPTRFNMPSVASPRVMSPRAIRDDSNRLLSPTSTHSHHHGFHQRNNSTSMTDMEQRDYNNERREKKYHPRPPYVQRVYDERAQARSSDDEWSYTNAHEQFDRDFPRNRDYPQDSPAHRGASRRERSTREYEVDRPAAKRDPAPVPTSDRPLENRDRVEGGRNEKRSGFESDPDRRSEAPRRRQSTHQPVVHQQAGREDGYSSARDEYGSRASTSHRSKRYEDDERPQNRPRDRHREDDNSREFDQTYYKDKDKARDREKDAERDRDSKRNRDRNREREREREREQERAPDRDRDRDRPREYEKDLRETRDYDRDQNRDYNRNYDRDQNRDYNRDYNRDHDRDYDRDDKDSRIQKNRQSKPRSRDSSPERSGLKSLATGALGTLAAAGVVKSFTRDQKDKDVEPEDEEPKERRRRKHRRRSRTEGDDNMSDIDSDRRKDERITPRPQESSSSETPDGQPPRRRHSHRRHRDDENTRKEQLAITEGQDGRGDSRVRSRDEKEPASDAERHSRELVPVSKNQSDLDYLETRTMSPGENEDDRPRRVQLVEPVKDKEESKPRGILKPTRQVPFPEDPNPIREGVAPLKDASKDGIPTNARWTKINRVLVNPEALEKLQERFEERDDYVIVLRVLTREEIKKFADKTKEIREIREKEWQQKLEEQRRLKITNGDGQPDSNEDQDGDDGARSRSQLAIEQGPAAAPVDFHSVQNSSGQQFPPRTNPAGPSALDTNVEASYSQNV